MLCLFLTHVTHLRIQIVEWTNFHVCSGVLPNYSSPLKNLVCDDQECDRADAGQKLNILNYLQNGICNH